MQDVLAGLSGLERAAAVIAIGVVAHLLVLVIRFANRRLLPRRRHPLLLKARTVTGLVTSAIIFALYFLAFGLVLEEFGVSLTAYLASASIIGLAVGFGSQGLVQDVVTGLTIILNDLFDVEDLVEIGGQVGIVQQVGIRFTIITNPLGAKVFIPNRSITSVVTYSRGWVRCVVDVRLPENLDQEQEAETTVAEIAGTMARRFPGLMRAPMENLGVMTMAEHRRYLRIKFRIWPGRGGPIETTFRQEVTQAMRALESGYADWMVSVTYESEETIIATP